MKRKKRQHWSFFFSTANVMRDGGKAAEPDRHPDSGEWMCVCVYPADQSLALAPRAGNHANVGWADSEPPGENNKRVCCLGRQSAVWPPALKMKEETRTEFTRRLSASPSAPSHTLFNHTPILIKLCLKVTLDTFTKIFINPGFAWVYKVKYKQFAELTSRIVRLFNNNNKKKKSQVKAQKHAVTITLLPVLASVS